MSQPRLEDFYKYFQELKEYVDLTNINNKGVISNLDEQNKVNHRIRELGLSMKKFRERVNVEIQKHPSLTQKVGKKVTKICTNKKCRHKFSVIQHPFLNVLYNCPKCKSSTIEMINT